MFKEDIKTVFPLLKELYDLDGLILVGSDITLWKELSEQTNIEDVYYVNTQEQKQISFPNEWHVHEQLLAKENGIVSYYDLSNSQLSGVVPSEALSTLWRNLKTVDVREKKALSLETFMSKVSSNKNALVVNSFDAVDIVQKSAGVEVVVAHTIDSDDESLTHYSKNTLDAQMKKLGYKALALLENKHPQVFSAIYALDIEKQKEELSQEILNAALQTKAQESEKLVKEQATLKEENQKVAKALETEKANAATLQKEKEETAKTLQNKNSEVETLKNGLKTKTETLTKSLEQEKQNTVNLKKELETLNAALQTKEQESEKLVKEQATLKEENQKVAKALETEKANAVKLQKEKEIFQKELSQAKPILKTYQKEKNYFIQLNYKSRSKYTHFSDLENEDKWQLEVYLHALGLMKKHDFKKVIDIGCGSGYKLMHYLHEYKTLGLELKENLKFLRKKYPERKWALSDFDSEKKFKADVVICSDVIEHLVDPNLLIDFIKRISFKYLVISTPDRELVYEESSEFRDGPPRNPAHVREWNFKEFAEYISSHFEVIDHRVTNLKQSTQMIICKKY